VLIRVSPDITPGRISVNSCKIYANFMIKENIEKILKELPQGVELVIAAKGRSADEVKAAVSSGVSLVGENYVQEAEQKFSVLGNQAKWHCIGHLQKNKIKKAVRIFDMIQTLDSQGTADLIDKECAKVGKVMPVLIEVNSGREEQKSGVLPQDVDSLIRKVIDYKNIKLMGLMTMGPQVCDVETLRPFFRETKSIFERVKALYGAKLEWRILSMGMSDSYRVAIEEGANMVRIGTGIFRQR